MASQRVACVRYWGWNNSREGLVGVLAVGVNEFSGPGEVIFGALWCILLAITVYLGIALPKRVRVRDVVIPAPFGALSRQYVKVAWPVLAGAGLITAIGLDERIPEGARVIFGLFIVLCTIVALAIAARKGLRPVRGNPDPKDGTHPKADLSTGYAKTIHELEHEMLDRPSGTPSARRRRRRHS